MNPKECEWVVASYRGEQAKRVKALAAEGLGYFIEQESGRGNSAELIVAFRRPCDGPTPENLIRVVDPEKIRRYEDRLAKRLGGGGGVQKAKDVFKK